MTTLLGKSSSTWAANSPTISRLALFLEADQAHLVVAVLFVQAVARGAAPVGHDHAGEPFILLLKALHDRAGRHDLNIVLVGGETQMSGACKCTVDGLAIRDENLCCIQMKLHI